MEALFSSKSPFSESEKKRSFYIPTPVIDKQSDEYPDVINAKRDLKDGNHRNADTMFIRSSGIILRDQVPTSDQIHFDESSGSSKYNETWPSTDQTIAELSADDPKTPQLQNKDSQDQSPAKQGNIQGSTLAKYIERFRKEPPKKKGERDQKTQEEKPLEFWWLSPPSSSSTPNTTENTPPKKVGLQRPLTAKEKHERLSPKRLQSKGQTLRRGIGSPATEKEFPKGGDGHLDMEIGSLQEKAEKLIELSESTLSSTTLSDFPTTKLKYPEPLSSEVRYKPIDESHRKVPIESIKRSEKPEKPMNREDDILYQWRLARKIAHAREKSPVHSFLDSRNKVLEPPHEKSSILSDSNPYRSNQTARFPNTAPSTEFLKNYGGEYTRTAPESVPTHRQPDSGTTLQSYSKPAAINISTQTSNSPPSDDLHSREVMVGPHLHMACDLIPCSHGHSHFVSRDNVLREDSSALRVDHSHGHSAKPLSPPVNRRFIPRADETINGKRTIKTLHREKPVKLNKATDKRVAESESPTTCSEGTMEAVPKRAHIKQRKETTRSTGNGDVQGTITQAVTHYLFGESEESEQDSQHTAISDINNIFEDSSEEEFPEDELLQNLRSRRKEYLKRLRKLREVYVPMS